MKRIYTVLERYDVDGGFGNSVPCEREIYTFAHKEDAEKFVEKYNNPHIYARPYASLRCGYLFIIEREIVDSFDPNLTFKSWSDDVYEPQDDDDDDDEAESETPCDYGECPYDAQCNDDCRRYCGLGVDE